MALRGSNPWRGAITGSSLSWSAVLEASNLLAGILAASALLRRRRSAAVTES